MGTRIPLAFLAFLLGSSACPLLNGQQSQWIPFSERRPLTNVGAILNKDAEASDPAGIHSYAEDLAHFLLPDRVGEKYINSFADRLAKAEQEAREGKRPLIPDKQVAEAFDQIARKANLPAMPASLEALRHLRIDPQIAQKYPALLTANRNGTKCSPGEAVYLIAVLLLEYEYPPSAPSGPCPPRPPEARAFRPGDVLPPAPQASDPFAPYIRPPQAFMFGTTRCEVLTSKEIDTLALEGPDTQRLLKVRRPPRIKRASELGRHGLTALFSSAAKTLGF